jgi:hypothetical protein
MRQGVRLEEDAKKGAVGIQRQLHDAIREHGQGNRYQGKEPIPSPTSTRVK